MAFSWLDIKLGLRMLVRYPGLTLVGGLSMAFAIWVGAVTFDVVSQMISPKLPLEDGDRIVGIHDVDIAVGRPTTPFLEDFVAWRGALTTVEELGAFRTVSRNLILGAGGSEPTMVAEISAAGFGVARVPPLLGRAIAEADEEPDAPPVVVIGYDVWRTRFGGDPDVVGRTVRVGSVTSAVVGVMPEGFAFPLYHRVWVPLRRSPVGLQPGQGGRVAVFGRLAPGRTVAEAQAELDVLGARRAGSFPEALGQVRPRVMTYARSVRPLPDIGAAGLLAANAFMVMLLVLICGNVALLMFARAATREGEIAVRSALGASRGRIVTQLFAEALVLGGVAALIGLVGAGYGEGLPLHRIAEASVDLDFFRTLDAPIRAGRGFDSGDPESDPRPVIVNRAFVDEVLGGGNPVGRRVRYAAPAGQEPGPWHEIVGVADNLGMIGGDGFYPEDEPGIYHPLARGETYPLDVAIRVRGAPESFASRLRTLAAAVDPGLRLHEIRRLDQVAESQWRESQFLYQLLGGVSLVALILSLTGIYSVMSFTVSRRTREIGVRVALGSDRRSIVVSIFRRPLVQVAAGIAVGAVLVSLLTRGLTGTLTASELGLVALYAALMFGICMLACIVPTRRALGVEPTDALRMEG
jgi:hypothetical protein